MSVYVDTAMQYVSEVDNYVGRPRAKARWCHMFADTDKELHAMATRIGLRREWFQDHPRLPHYDLVPSKRALAIKFGALGVGRKEVVDMMRRNVSARTQG